MRHEYQDYICKFFLFYNKISNKVIIKCVK